MAESISLPLPPVERVRPSIWSIPVPLPMNSLRYVLVYVFETDRGPYLVDAGWNTDEAFEALTSGLVEVGTSLQDVQGVLVTHIHPDHYGLAGRIRESSGAWIALHPADARLIHDRYEDPAELLQRMDAMLRRYGAPVDEREALTQSSMKVLPFVTPGAPDILIEDLEKPDVPEWDLLALWTPGHSPGHLCFWEPRNSVLLSGDHVLPRITPNISLHPQAGNNPLGDFLHSLDRVAEFPALEVFPAHEHRFTDLAGRVAALHAHHEERFSEILAAIASGTDTAWAIAAGLHWSRPWERLNSFNRRSAVLETVAHLRALEIEGVLFEDNGEPSRWEQLRDRT